MKTFVLKVVILWESWKQSSIVNLSANISLFKVNNKNTRKKIWIYSKLTIETPELRLFWCIYC